MRIVLAVCGLLVATSISFAADLPQPAPAIAPAPYVPPPAPVYNWSGPYIGGNGGYGWATFTGTASVVGGSGAGTSVTSSHNADGGIAGGQIGFNWQIQSLVLGAEADMQWSGQSETQTELSCLGLCSISGNGGIDWFGTARARVGFAVDRVLVYGTGGLAWAHTFSDVSVSGFGVTANLASLSSAGLGLTAGAGVEVGITPWLSAKVEYLFLDFSSGSASSPVNVLGGTVTDTGSMKDSIVRAGLNLRYPVGQP